MKTFVPRFPDNLKYHPKNNLAKTPRTPPPPGFPNTVHLWLDLVFSHFQKTYFINLRQRYLEINACQIYSGIFSKKYIRYFDCPTLNFTESVEVIQTIRLEMALPSCPLMQSKEKKIVKTSTSKCDHFVQSQYYYIKRMTTMAE